MKKNQILQSIVILCFLMISKITFAENSGTYNLIANKDSYVSEENSRINYGNSMSLYAGRGTEFGYQYRTYLGFDPSALPDDATIVSAELRIYVSNITNPRLSLQLQKVSGSWLESSINWSNQPSSRTNLSTISLIAEDDWVNVDVTSTVQEWFDDGVVSTFAIGPSVVMDDNCIFFSSEARGCNPYIYIVYTTEERVPESPEPPSCGSVTDASPPSVEISFSANPIALDVSSVVHVSGSDPQGIYSIQLYMGSTLIDEEISSSHTTSIDLDYTFHPTNPGPVTFWAMAYNNAMEPTIMSATQLVNVDGEPPVVNLYHLPQDPDIGDPVTLYLEASDPSGISSLSIEVNGTRHHFEVGSGRTSIAESIPLSEADPFYNPSTTRVVTYSATAYDEESNHTVYGPKYILFSNGDSPDSDGDGLDDAIEEILGLDSDSKDTDDDGLYDSWEVLGVDRDGDGTIDLDLPGWGATPHHKDMFVEFDWLEDATHSHKPNPWAIQTAINIFQCYGIRMHADVGGLGGGGPVPHSCHTSVGGDGSDLMALVRPDYSDHNRYGIFRYVLCGHVWGVSYGMGMVLVRTEPPNADNHYDESYFQAHQIVHELGHSLNFLHGGQTHYEYTESYVLDHDFTVTMKSRKVRDGLNYKPNYLSIMNYLYERLWGLRAMTTSGYEIVIASFSHDGRITNDLNEAHLNESQGLDFPLFWGMHTWRRRTNEDYKINDWFEGTYYVYKINSWSIDGDGHLSFSGEWVLADGSPIDWDNDGNSSETDVEASLNCNDNIEWLYASNDVDNFFLPVWSHQSEYIYWLDPEDQTEPIGELTDEVCDGLDNDCDGMIDEGYPDLDEDGIADFIDNAVHCYNPYQEDLNHNFIGDKAELPPGKVKGFNGTFDTTKMKTELSWIKPSSPTLLLGYNVYRKDRTGDSKRIGVSYPSTLSTSYSDEGPFLLDYTDSLTYYVRPVNIYMVEGEKSDEISFLPSVQTITSMQTKFIDGSVKAFPNPFSELTTIAYEVIHSGYVNISIYNIMGQKVACLVDLNLTEGKYKVEWNGTNGNGARLSPGNYFCTIQTEKYTKTLKIVLGR